MPLDPLMRRVDFVPDNYIWARVRVLPVLAICPPRAFPKDNVEVGRALLSNGRLFEAVATERAAVPERATCEPRKGPTEQSHPE
jgi:hypothetical protein